MILDIISSITSASVIGLFAYIFKIQRDIARMDIEIEHLKTEDIRKESQLSSILSAINNIEQCVTRLEVKMEMMNK